MRWVCTVRKRVLVKLEDKNRTLCLGRHMDHLADSTANCVRVGRTEMWDPWYCHQEPPQSVDFDVFMPYLSLPKKNLTLIRRIWWQSWNFVKRTTPSAQESYNLWPTDIPTLRASKRCNRSLLNNIILQCWKDPSLSDSLLNFKVLRSEPAAWQKRRHPYNNFFKQTLRLPYMPTLKANTTATLVKQHQKPYRH